MERVKKKYVHILSIFYLIFFNKKNKKTSSTPSNIYKMYDKKKKFTFSPGRENLQKNWVNAVFVICT